MTQQTTDPAEGCTVQLTYPFAYGEFIATLSTDNGDFTPKGLRETLRLVFREYAESISLQLEDITRVCDDSGTDITIGPKGSTIELDGCTATFRVYLVTNKQVDGAFALLNIMQVIVPAVTRRLISSTCQRVGAEIGYYGPPRTVEDEIELVTATIEEIFGVRVTPVPSHVVGIRI